MSLIDDQSSIMKAWKRLLEPASRDLMELLRLGNPEDVSFLQRLRRDWPAEFVHAGIELTRARDKAEAKFSDPQRLVADVLGVEQATSEIVATHKSRRFATLEPERVIDLCCGIGGDAMSLNQVAPVLAVDRDPLKCWMTRHNADCETQTSEVEALSIHDSFFHLDPSRRSDDQHSPSRLWRFEDYQPGPDFLMKLLATCPNGAVKLGPGVDLKALPRPNRYEVEFISERGSLTQAVLWLGRLAFHAGQMTATRFPDAISFTAEPASLPIAPIKSWIFTVDPAIERAKLLGSITNELGLQAIHPELGLLTADNAVDSPWLTPFEVCTDMPLRKKKIKAWLVAHEAGLIEVKTRGKAVDPNHWQTELRGTGKQPFTVFLLRFDQAMRAIICRRPAS